MFLIGSWEGWGTRLAGKERGWGIEVEVGVDSGLEFALYKPEGKGKWVP